MEPIQLALLGLGAGAAYVLIGHGIVLTYRGAGIVNFAQGAIAMLGAELFYGIRDRWHLPAVVALVAALTAAAAIGLAMQLIVLRLLRHAAGLTRLISTFALFTLVLGIAQLVWGSGGRVVNGLLPTRVVHLGTLAISEDRLSLVGLALVLTTILWLLYQRTRYGLATSAIAENPQAAVTLGWSPDLIGAANWALGCTLACIAGILLSPIAGLTVTTLSLAVVPGLAAALVGQFSSFWLTLAGGMAIGVAQAEIVRYLHVQGWSDAVPLLAIVAVVVFRGRALPLRGELIERPVRLGAGHINPLVVALLAGAGALAIGLLTPSWTLAFTTSALFGLVALSLVTITGYAGQISLAQLTIAGVGALAAANAAHRWDFPFIAAVGFGALCAGLVGLIVGLPALRCRGLHLAIVTIAVSLSLEELVLNNATLTGGVAGFTLPPPHLFGIDIGYIHHSYRFALVVFLACILSAVVVSNLRRGPTGRRLLAVRANERAAASTGVNVYGAKLYAFTIGSAIAGLAGALAVFQFPQLDLTPYTTLGAIQLLVTAVIGGLGFIGGAVFAGLGYSGGLSSQLLSYLRGRWAEILPVLVGASAFQILIAAPDGLSDLQTRQLRRLAANMGRGETSSIAQTPLAHGHRPPAGRKTLRVRGLDVAFGGVQALTNVDLDLAPGEVLGLIGPNGAGKTTLIDAVSGFVACRGSISLGGDSLTGLRPSQRARRGIGRTFQAVELFDDLSVADNIRAAAEASSGSSYWRDIIWPRSAPLPDVAHRAIDTLELRPLLDRRSNALPAGQRRMVGIARVLASAPSVLLLDEPAAGLNTEERRELSSLIRHLAEDWQLAVLLVEHDVELVTAISDRVIALALGRAIAEGRPSDVLASESVRTSYLGNAHTSPSCLPERPLVP